MEGSIENRESKSYVNDLLSFLNEQLYNNDDISFSWFLDGAECLRVIKAERDVNDTFVSFESIVSVNSNQILDEIDFLNTEVAHFLIKSIISGEYVCYKDFEELLKKVVSIVENYYQDFIYEIQEKTFSNEISRDLNIILKNNFVNVIKTLIQSVLAFTTGISQIDVNSNLDVIHSYKTNEHDLKLTNKNRVYLTNLHLTLSVFYLDHILEEDDDYINSLFKVQQRLDIESQNPDFICAPILNIKLNFLKQKWVFRKHKNSLHDENRLGIQKAFVIDDEVITLHENFDFIGGNDKLVDWIAEITRHYELSHTIFNPYARLKKIDSASNKTLRELIKYYKDQKKDPSKLLEVIKVLEGRVSQDSRMNLNVLYAKNCLLSLYLKNNYSKELIYEIYDSITQLQEKCKIINFFADLKILEYEVNHALDVIRKYTEGKDKSIEFIDSVNAEKLQMKLDFLLEVFYDSCKYNRFLYYLPYEESCIESDSHDVERVYYHSSVFLPIAFSENQNKINKIQVNIAKVKAYMTSFDLVKNDLNEIKIIKEELKDSNRRIIEIVSMFTAIISFILGSVGAFSFIGSFSHAMLFVALYGVCVSLFVISFYFMNRGFEIRLKHLLILVPYGLVFLVLYFYLLPNYQNDLNSKLGVREEKIIKRKLDSLQDVNEKNFYKIESKTKSNKNIQK